MDAHDRDGGQADRGHAHRPGLSRRGFLGGVGVAAGASLVPVAGLRPAAASQDVSLTGARPLRTAMHVHASWSEGPASWAMQYDRADEAGIDLMFMTDHDVRALADDYIDSLADARHVSSSTGAARQRAATASGGTWHLLAQSSGSAPASTSLAVDPQQTAVNHLRTSIAGHTLAHTFGPSTLGPGATYEVAVTLSLHPAHGTRPAGQLELRYHFENRPGSGYQLTDGGLVGVVSAPLPRAGATVRMPLEDDVARLWPDVLAADNALYGLSFTVTSPRSGAVADVQVRALTFTRTQNDEASIVRNQQRVIDAYGPRHPGLTVQPDVEVSKLQPHLNAFLLPQFMPPQAQFTHQTLDSAYVRLVRGVHSGGGLVSLNHPFGANVGPALGAPAAADRRREVFRSLLPTDAYGVDVIEAGYALRGQVGTDVHLDLWDTFSRRGRFLTGNGANDDHSGQPWKRLSNGFFTGIWSASTSEDAVQAALAGGRAFSAHLGRFPGCAIDMLVDGRVAMGQAGVARKASRTLALYVDGLPSGAFVEIVQGVVDGTGTDPLTTVLDRLPASAFSSGGGTVSRSVDTTSSCFVRAQVRDSHNKIIGFGNPVWLLRSAPAGGVPLPRRP